MDNKDKNLTAEEKIKIINLVAISQTREELTTFINNYLSKNQEQIEVPPLEENYNIDPTKIDISTINSPNIYDQKYRHLVEMDRQNHPRENEKIKLEVPEEQIPSDTIRSTSPSYGLNEIVPPLEEPEKPKVLEKTINNPWASSGAKTVSPGELNLE